MHTAPHDIHKLEREQSVIRVVICVLVLIWTGIQFESRHDSATVLCFAIALGGALFSVLWLLLIWRRPSARGLRRYVVATIDQGICCWLLHVGGETLVPLVASLPWVTLGNGMRFGKSMLLFAASIGFVGLGIVVLTAHPWVDHPYLSVGVVISNLVVPAYVAVLLGRLERAQASLAAKAAAFAHDASHDVLTGLLNKRSFESRCTDLLLEAFGHGSTVGLIYLDLDGFKAVNDVHGHAAGDAVLAKVSDRLSRAFRRTDLVARLGGDEFAVAVIGVDEEFLRKSSDQLKAAVASITRVDDKVVEIGVSCGCVLYRPNVDGEPEMNAIVRKADEAMYADKALRKATAGATGTRDSATRQVTSPATS